MALNKAKTIEAFHNMLSMQIKNLTNGMEVEEKRVKNMIIFRYFTEDPAERYVIQVTTDVTQTGYKIDVMVIEETVVQDETTGNLVDNKVFEVRDLGFRDKGVKLVCEYIRGAAKAVTSNTGKVFDDAETAEVTEEQ